MLQYRCNINYYYFAKIGWKNFQEDRGSWNRRNAKRLAIDRKHADKRITGHAGQGQMRRRVTAGRLGKLGLTLFALAGVFFSLFASVLDPVVWAAALLGWGGLSVHGQSAAVLSGTDLPLGPYLAAKAAQAALSALLAWPVSRYLWG